MTDEATAELFDDGTGWQPEPYALPRTAAVANLAAALFGRGLSEEAVEALARAVVQPDDMRRKLTDVNKLRVQGGTLHIVETRLWSASVVPHPANPREYGRRSYALGAGSAAAPGLLPEPESAPGDGPELRIRVSHPSVLAQRLEEAKQRLVKENPLDDDIAAEGVLQPLTVIPMTVHHESFAHRPTALLITADGSSRISSVHELLGFLPAVIAYQWGRDARAFRREVNRWLRLAQKQGWDSLSPAEKGKLRALTVPARVVVGFVPDVRAGVRFHTAVRNFIGLTHIRPPKPYGSAVENEAKGDAVLDSLAEPTRSRPARITLQEKRWFAGVITEQEAAEEGFSQHWDVRAAEIVRTLLGGGVGTTRRVNAGIRSLTAKQRPRREDRVDIAVELILRPVRTEKNNALQYTRPRRAVLQRAYRLPEIVDLPADALLEGAIGGGQSLEELRDAALKEAAEGLGASGRLGIAQTELAVKAAYYMVTADTMALQTEGSGAARAEDSRSTVGVLRAMLSQQRGVIQAYEVVRAGRLGSPLHEVDEEGTPVRTAEGGYRELTDALVRHTYNGETFTAAAAGLPAARARWATVTKSVENLGQAVQHMAAVPVYEGGESLVEREGWDVRAIEEVRSGIDKISRKLADWGDLQHAQNNEEEKDVDLDAAGLW
ncbi:hypothetical protein B7P34_06115 [Streptosporangium nondiastaticum]|uniref:Uncharacterized protein n=1 Tax=Streptosporangium nondiastaticum TaxID=35764 RepID=A0A9X7PIW8_9ACTN|nr:hypothetical protein [Streptosporangium nondiastaticum]PSJ29634.1 hypothetical protein B7P34_06115 [Streptosporangium nondiastaticum]